MNRSKRWRVHSDFCHQGFASGVLFGLTSFIFTACKPLILQGKNNMISQKELKKICTEVLEDNHVKIIDPNALLLSHNEHFQHLEKQFVDLQKTVQNYETRLNFAEQVARESITIKDSENFQKMLTESKQALEEAFKLTKYCKYMLEALVRLDDDLTKKMKQKLEQQP